MNDLYRTILKNEARLGAKIFGNSDDSEKMFYCLDANTWVWHQDSVTVFYKVNSTNVYKSYDRLGWQLAGKEEIKRLNSAAKVYKNLIEANVFKPLLALR